MSALVRLVYSGLTTTNYTELAEIYTKYKGQGKFICVTSGLTFFIELRC